MLGKIQAGVELFREFLGISTFLGYIIALNII